jgi:hypothetical protein
MIDEPPFAVSSPQKAEVDPHRLLNSGFGDMHHERVR